MIKRDRENERDRRWCGGRRGEESREIRDERFRRVRRIPRGMKRTCEHAGFSASLTRCPFFSSHGRHISERASGGGGRGSLASFLSPTPTRYTLHAVATTPLHAEPQWCSVRVVSHETLRAPAPDDAGIEFCRGNVPLDAAKDLECFRI